MVKRANQTCFAICVISLIAAAGMGLVMIWLPESSGILIRAQVSAMVVFITSGAILAISRAMRP